MGTSKYFPETGVTKHLLSTGIRRLTNDEANIIWSFMRDAEDDGHAYGCSYTSWGRGLFRFTGIFTNQSTAMEFKLKWDSDTDEVSFAEVMRG
jgi:hypothetical protein